MILPKIKPIVESWDENSKPKAELRMSSAGDCPRLMDYELQVGKKSHTFEDAMRMEMGHSAHYLLQKLFSRALGDDIFDMEKEISLTTPAGLVIPGHNDGRIKSLGATLEIKSVSENTFTMVKNQNKPLDQHIDQANLYAFTFKDPWVLIVYINRNTGEFLEFMFETSEDLAHQIMGKFDAAKHRLLNREMVKRPYADATESPCWYCPYVKECYDGFSNQVAGFISTPISDSTLVDLARKAITHRNSRLVSDKLEKQVNALLAKSLHDINVKDAEMKDETGTMKASISVGKNNNLLISIREK